MLKFLIWRYRTTFKTQCLATYNSYCNLYTCYNISPLRSTNSSSLLTKSSSSSKSFQVLVGKAGLTDCLCSKANGNKDDKRAEFLRMGTECTAPETAWLCSSSIFTCRLCTSSIKSKILAAVAIVPPPWSWASGIHRRYRCAQTLISGPSMRGSRRPW